MRTDKALIIFIEGQDRSGKSSLIKPLFESLGKVHNVLDRGPLSNLVYSKMYHRTNIDLDSYSYHLRNKRILTIYLDVNEKVLAERTLSSGDFGVPLDMIHTHKVAWENTVKTFINNKNFFSVPSSESTIEQTVDYITKLVNFYIEEELR